MTSQVIVTCPSCGSGNRIPADREGMRGRCGSCQTALPPMYRTPQQLNTGTFDTFLGSYSGPVLAEFWAPW
jgi:thioredoxin 2